MANLPPEAQEMAKKNMKMGSGMGAAGGVSEIMDALETLTNGNYHCFFPFLLFRWLFVV
ncbi:MAG: hypothetical protein IPP05_21150 [Cytophagaceae bacterium]|nr:hypothetical protein [Cytophagaceae bacterium]